jgi:hypothetical protein
MAATAPLEITELARSSAAVSERALAALPPPKATQELLNNFADQILDVRADTLAFYKIAVLDARRANSADEVAAIWKEVLSFARATLELWKKVRVPEPVTEKLIEHHRQFLIRFEATAREHYEAHSRESFRRLNSKSLASFTRAGSRIWTSSARRRPAHGSSTKREF